MRRPSHREVVSVVVRLDGKVHELPRGVVELVAGRKHGAAAGDEHSIDHIKAVADLLGAHVIENGHDARACGLRCIDQGAAGGFGPSFPGAEM